MSAGKKRNPKKKRKNNEAIFRNLQIITQYSGIRTMDQNVLILAI
jgi:hypothetical protein